MRKCCFRVCCLDPQPVTSYQEATRDNYDHLTYNQSNSYLSRNGVELGQKIRTENGKTEKIQNDWLEHSKRVYILHGINTISNTLSLFTFFPSSPFLLPFSSPILSFLNRSSLVFPSLFLFSSFSSPFSPFFLFLFFSLFHAYFSSFNIMYVANNII